MTAAGEGTGSERGTRSKESRSSGGTPYKDFGLTPAQIRRMEPQDVFRLFDADGSGLISFEGTPYPAVEISL